MERKFVTGIGGSANRAKRGEINVEGGEMFKGELGFFCWDGSECLAFVEAAFLKPVESVSP